jgi:hypothetical protein
LSAIEHWAAPVAVAFEQLVEQLLEDGGVQLGGAIGKGISQSTGTNRNQPKGPIPGSLIRATLRFKTDTGADRSGS